MAVRLRDVSASEDEPAGTAIGRDETLRPSERIMGGRIADKLGSRMGLRLSSERIVAEFADLELRDALHPGSAAESCSR